MIKEEVTTEIDVLKAIFGDDFIEYPSVWNQPCFAIKVKPTASIHTQVYNGATVLFTIHSAYPKTPPKIELIETFGLNQQDLKQLRQQLTDKAKSLEGDVMCYELICIVQSFLEYNNHQPTDLFNSMIQRQQRENQVLNQLQSGNDMNTTQHTVNKNDKESFPRSERVNSNQQDKEQTNNNFTLPTLGNVVVKRGSDSNEIKEIPSDDDINDKLSEDFSDDIEINSTISDEEETLERNHYDRPKGHEQDAQHGATESVEAESDGINNSSSRYKQEFIEICALGKGVSGEVWKVRNKLDRGLYAIKKVRLPADSQAHQSIRREVTTISKMLHKHIVRYYAAWIEEEIVVQESFNHDGESYSGSGSHPSTIQSDVKVSSFPLPGFRSHSQRESSIMSSILRNPIMDEINDQLDSLYQDNPGNNKLNSILEHNEAGDDIQFGDSDDDESDEADEGNRIMLQTHNDYDDDDSGSDNDEDDQLMVPRGESKDNDDFNDLWTETVNPSSGETHQSSVQSPDTNEQTKIVTQSKLGVIKRTLFIQMEYCYTTLRDEIDKGKFAISPNESKVIEKRDGLSSAEQDVARLLRQLLEALAYIHGRRVIHRDFKPANIFLDGDRNIKIGDFGLATSGKKVNDQSSVKMLNVGDEPELKREESLTYSEFEFNENENAFNSASLTEGVGTALYCAPEQEKQTGFMPQAVMNNSDRIGRYNEKADMFSLGIILFEMVHPPFTTGSARIVAIQQLRSDCIISTKLVEMYGENHPFLIITKWLVKRNPMERPSALDLLKSDILPSKVDTDLDYLKEITEALWRPKSDAANSIISVLFRSPLTGLYHNPTPNDPSNLNKDIDLIEREASLYEMNIILKDLNRIKPVKHWFMPESGLIEPLVDAKKETVENKAYSIVRYPIENFDSNPIECISNPLQIMIALKNHMKLTFESYSAVEFMPSVHHQLRTNALAFHRSNSNTNVVSKRQLTDEVDYLDDVRTINDVHGIQSSDHQTKFLLDEFSVLSTAGQVLTFLKEFTTHYARYCAYLNISQSRRYHFGSVLVSHTKKNHHTLPLVDGNTHPIVKDLAVFDIVIPWTHQEDHLQADIEVEVMCATIKSIENFIPFLPRLAIRISSSHLFKAIIDLCSWKILVEMKTSSNDTSLNSTAVAGPLGHTNATESNQESSRDSKKVLRSKKLMTYFIVSEKILNKLLDYLSHLADNPIHKTLEAIKQQFLTQFIDLPEKFTTRLINFLYLISTQLNPTLLTSDPLDFLTKLYTEFYQSEVVIKMQMQIAMSSSLPSPGKNKDAINPLQWIGQGGMKGKDSKMVKEMDEIKMKEEQKKGLIRDWKRLQSIVHVFNKSIEELKRVLIHFLAVNRNQNIIILIDFGVSKAIKEMNQVYPFDYENGVGFILEAFHYPSLRLVTNEFPSNRLDSTHQQLLLRRYKHHKGIIAVGGHFEHLIHGYRKYSYNSIFHSNAINRLGTNNPELNTFHFQNQETLQPPVIAFGVLIEMDRILSFVMDYQHRQRNLNEHLDKIRQRLNTKDKLTQQKIKHLESFYQDLKMYNPSFSCNIRNILNSPLDLLIVPCNSDQFIMFIESSSIEYKEKVIQSMHMIQSNTKELVIKMNLNRIQIIPNITSKIRAMGLQCDTSLNQLHGVSLLNLIQLLHPKPKGQADPTEELPSLTSSDILLRNAKLSDVLELYRKVCLTMGIKHLMIVPDVSIEDANKSLDTVFENLYGIFQDCVAVRDKKSVNNGSVTSFFPTKFPAIRIDCLKNLSEAIKTGVKKDSVTRSFNDIQGTNTESKNTHPPSLSESNPPNLHRHSKGKDSKLGDVALQSDSSVQPLTRPMSLQVVPLRILESSQNTASSQKDKKSVTSSRKKDIELVCASVETAYRSLWKTVHQLGSTETNQSSIRVEITSQSKGVRYYEGQVIAIDLPLRFIRNLNTIIMTRLNHASSALSSTTTSLPHSTNTTNSTTLNSPHGSTASTALSSHISHQQIVLAKSEFDALCNIASNEIPNQYSTSMGSNTSIAAGNISSFSFGNYRKALIALVSELSSYSNFEKSSKIGQNSADTTNKLPATNQNLQKGLIQVIVYSIPDSAMDILSYHPLALERAKLS